MKILLVSMGFLGDLVLSTPCVQAALDENPGSCLTVLTTPPGHFVYKDLNGVSEVLVYDKRGAHKGVKGFLEFVGILKSHNFDKVYSVHRSFRTALLLALASIPERVGFAVASGSWLYNKKRDYNDHSYHYVLKQLSLFPLSEKKDSKAQLALPKLSLDSSFILEEPFVVFAPGSVWNTKMWNWQGYASLASKIERAGLRVVLVGDKKDQKIGAKIAEVSNAIDYTGKTSITDLFSIISSATLVVCNDSAALHIASVFKIPTVAIFCATSPTFGFGPWNNIASEVIEKKGLYCKPCRRHGSRSCPNGTELCMRGISADEVFSACKRVLKMGTTSLTIVQEDNVYS